MIRNSHPLPWRAKGLSDTIDGSTSFNGAMASLSNLIPDPTTAQLWQCRPAAFVKATFSGAAGSPFSTGFSSGFQQSAVGSAGAVSAFKIIGNIAYGLVGNPDGYDHPFAFNLLTNTMLSVGGTITPGSSGTLPASQPTSGAWIPPIMDLVGSRLMVAHFGFNNAAPANRLGWFDISAPSSPVWNAGTLTGPPPAITTAVPIAVAQFYNRAYWIYNITGAPALVASDILAPTTVTTVSGAGTQILTLGDSAPLTALGQLRFYNQLGGIIQGLVVFKGVANTYQITGDFALGNLSINAMNFATGTLSPLSVISTPRGLGFMSPEGFRIIDFQSNISDPIGIDGQGVTAPFLYAVQPTRVVAACNGNIVRISTQNALAAGSGGGTSPPTQEYWYDIGRQVWHGPHTFPASIIQPWMGTFVMAASGVPGILWQSDPVQNATSVFTENGVPLSWTYKTAFLPDTDQMSNVALVQSLLTVQLTAGAPAVSITALSQNNSVIDSTTLALGGANTTWLNFNWGQANWGATATALAARILAWKFPLVFVKAQFMASGRADTNTRLGEWHFRYKVLRYITSIGAAA